MNVLPVKPPASKKKKLIRKREKLKKNAKLKKKPKRKKKLWPKWLWPLRGKCFGH